MDEKADKPVFDFEAVFEPDDYLYFYEDVINEESTRPQIEFLAKELELDKPMKILDLACGHGRHANGLAELGHIVTGVDISPGFLEIARRDAKEQGVTVEYVQQDMREISYAQEFDRVLLLFTSFGYFEDDENFKVLQNVASALKPGGLFCFDIINRDVFLKNLRPFGVTEKGGDLMINRETFDSLTGRVYNRRIVIRDSKRKDTRFFVRLHNATETRDLLGGAGLHLHKIFGSWDGRPFQSYSWRMIILARKHRKQ